MTSRNKEEPPRPGVIVERASSAGHNPGDPKLRTYVREFRSGSGKGTAYSYVYYGPKKGGRLSTVKLGLGLAVLMAGLFVIVVLGGLIFLGLFAALVVVAAISRIFGRK